MEYCDRCGALGKVRIVLPSGGELVFCGHHAHEYEDVLERLNAAIYTEDLAELEMV
jgi:hypothetical protein